MSQPEYAKSSDTGCAIFMLFGIILLLAFGVAKLDDLNTRDHCLFERRVAKAIHNGHIITDDCKRKPR